MAKIPISTYVTVNFSYVLDKGVQFITKYYKQNKNLFKYIKFYKAVKTQKNIACSKQKLFALSFSRYLW